MDGDILIRIPGWARNQAMPSELYHFQSADTNQVTIKVNGIPITYTLENGYASIDRKWKKGDVITVDLPMEVRRVTADQRIKDDIDKVALQRGPLMYCAEWADNAGKTDNILLAPGTAFSPVFMPDLLNGVMVLKGTVSKVVIENAQKAATISNPFVAIPYYAWANRGKGEMTLWFPEKLNYLTIN